MILGSAGVLAPGKWRPLRAMAWLGALCVAIVLIFNAMSKATLWLRAWAIGAPLSSASRAPDSVKLLAAVAGCIALVATYWAAVRVGERRQVPELRFRGLDLLAGLALGGALMAAIVGALLICGWASVEARPTDRIALALRDSLRSGVLEELVLRLVIFRLVWRAFGIWPALAGSALLFGVLHLVNPDSSAFAATCLIAGEGIGIGLFLLTGRIWAPIGMHAAWNFTQGWVFGAAVSGTTEIAGGPLALRPAKWAAETLSGGGFGPEASWAALIISSAASAALLVTAWKQGRFVAADT